jgi:hypothetical protein
VAGSFEIRKPGKIELRVTDLAGQESTDVFTAPVAVLADEKPSIRIAEPPAVSFATPDVTLPVVLAAEDDYGLTRVQLYRSLNDSRGSAMEWALPKPAPTRWSATGTLPLATYGLLPGDEIKLFARAEDNDPAGPNGAESAIVVVRIISQEDYERLARAREGMEIFLSKYRQAQRRVEGLTNEIERLRKKAKQQTADEAEKELAKLADKMREEAQAIRKAAELKLSYDLDQALRPHLDRMARRLTDLSESTRKLAGARLSGADLERALEKLRQALEEQQQELQHETVEPLEHLALILPLLEDSARFVELAARQQGLAERLRSIKDQEKVQAPNLKPRLRDLQAEQQQMRLNLQKLLEDIEDHAGLLPEDPKLEDLRAEALDFVKQVRASAANDVMTEAERGLAELSGKRGHAWAQEAADTLDKFVKRCQGQKGMGARGRMRLRFQPSLASGLGMTVEQLLADMGLNPGGGSGGNGYSTQRSTLGNMGLYGNLPAIESARDSRSAHGGRAAQSRGAGGRGSDPARPGSNGGTAQTDTQGAADAAVPLTYRRRVADYFQRIADETGGR